MGPPDQTYEGLIRPKTKPKFYNFLEFGPNLEPLKLDHIYKVWDPIISNKKLRPHRIQPKIMGLLRP